MKSIIPAVSSMSTWLMAMAALAAFVPQGARADKIAPPSVPADLVVPAGNKPFLVGHAFGAQSYICLPSATSTTGFAFTLFTPQATLLLQGDGHGQQPVANAVRLGDRSPEASPSRGVQAPLTPAWRSRVER